MFLGDPPLRGAPGMVGEKMCFWGSSSCAGLLEWLGTSFVSRRAPAARGSRNGGMAGFGGKLLLCLDATMVGENRSCVADGELPLRGAVGMVGEKMLCFWGGGGGGGGLAPAAQVGT